MIKLIATDMDGTLLDATGSFDRARFGEILVQLEERGIPFVVASGNHISRLLALFAGYEDRVLFIADNGAHIYEKGKTIYRYCFSSRQVAEVVSFYGRQAKDVCLMLSHDKAIYMAKGAGYPFDESLAIEEDQKQAFLDKIQWVPDLSIISSTEQIYKIGLWVPEDCVEAVVSAFNQAFLGRLTAVTSGYGSIDILPINVHKASGLKQVLDTLAVSPNEVMAFGDSDNDLEMLAYVGYSYAMENATDKVKQVATYRANSHIHAGVFTAIEEYLQYG